MATNDTLVLHVLANEASRVSGSLSIEVCSAHASGARTREGSRRFQVPANGRPLDIESWSVHRLEDGKVVEHVGLNDAINLMMQLGAIPAPE